MPATLSEFARTLEVETAFTVLARAKELTAAGKDVVELEIGDSPFDTTPAAKEAGIRAIRDNQTHYCPSTGLPQAREGIAQFAAAEWGLKVSARNVVVGHGAKIFELLFCEAFLNPGDGVLVFSPYFPTYLPNIQRRGARTWIAPLRQEHSFRPELAEVERFLTEDPQPKAIFLNWPHNPTGGIATQEDLAQLADLVRGRDIALFSDEPYCHMVWTGQHHSVLQQPGMLEQTVAAYTFSKSYSMSGWRLGFALASADVANCLGKLINTSLSCVPPLVQLAGLAALKHDAAHRDRDMQRFRKKVDLLTEGLKRIEGVRVVPPGGTFYVFPNVARICNRLGITSHGLAMYLLEGADDHFGVACLGGECFGQAGAGFLRFSCAEPDDRLQSALNFLPEAFSRVDRVQRFLDTHAAYRITCPYTETSAGPQDDSKRRE